MKHISIQTEEVQNVKRASVGEIDKMIDEKNFIPSILPGLEMIKNYYKMLATFKQR